LSCGNSGALLLNELFETFNLHQLINEPTRVTLTSETLLDILVTSDSRIISDVNVVNMHDVSDHYLTTCNLLVNKPVSIPRFHTFRDFKYFNYHWFVEHVSVIDWDLIYEFTDINLMVDFLVKNIKGLFDLHAPVRTVRITKPWAPWLTETIKSMIKLRDSAFVQYKRSRSIGDFSYYKQLRNYVTAAIRREKKAYIEHKFRTGGSAELWKTLRSLNIHNNNNSCDFSFTNAENLNAYFLFFSFFAIIYVNVHFSKKCTA